MGVSPTGTIILAGYASVRSGLEMRYSLLSHEILLADGGRPPISPPRAPEQREIQVLSFDMVNRTIQTFCRTK